MSVNGRTAIDLSLMAAAWGAFGSPGPCSHALPTKKYAATNVATTTAPAMPQTRRDTAALSAGVDKAWGNAGADPGARCRPTASTSFAIGPSAPPAPVSIHCDWFKKYSKARVSGAASTFNATIGWRLEV